MDPTPSRTKRWIEAYDDAMNPEKLSPSSGARNESGPNVVHTFFSGIAPEVKLLIDASSLNDREKASVVGFYNEFVSHLADEAYVERVMVSTGPIIGGADGQPLRRTRLEDGTYSLENSLYVFAESFDAKFSMTHGEMREVRKSIVSLLKEALGHTADTLANEAMDRGA